MLKLIRGRRVHRRNWMGSNPVKAVMSNLLPMVYVENGFIRLNTTQFQSS